MTHPGSTCALVLLIGATSLHGHATAAAASGAPGSSFPTSSSSASTPPASSPVLQEVADAPLPGGTSRFDYQSFDPQSGRLFISHMGDGRLVVFDVRRERVIADLPGFPRLTGVLFVPELNRVYASAAGAHEVVVLDAGSLAPVGRVDGISFPDGIAFDPTTRRVFVSDESGGADFVIDADTNRRIARTPLGGEAGNTRCDSVGGRIYVAVQTKNELAAIDPKTMRIAARYPLPGAEEPHGFYIDAPRRLLFVSCEGNARLLVFDLRTMAVTGNFEVGDGPDVLAFDPGLKRLYVSSESGIVSVFEERGDGLAKLGEVRAPNAHTVAVDPATHRVFLPLKNVNGRPVLRVMTAVS